MKYYRHGVAIYSASGLPLKVKVGSERFWVFFSLNKPLFRIYTEEECKNYTYEERNRLRIIPGQSCIVSSADAPHWVLNHCLPSFNKFRALNVSIWKYPKFSRYIKETCEERFSSGRLDGIYLELSPNFKYMRKKGVVMKYMRLIGMLECRNRKKPEHDSIPEEILLKGTNDERLQDRM
jgi:hypothetical protein